MEQNRSQARTDRPMGAMGGEGRLIFQVSTAGGAIPLEGAEVTVRSVKNIPSTDGEQTGMGGQKPPPPLGDQPNGDARQREGTVIAVLYSDPDGKTEILRLPAPARSLSMQPNAAGSPMPYSLYDAEIRLEGFYNQSYISIPIFDGITSIQHAALIPLPENGTPDGARPDDERFYESENPDL